MNTNAFGYVSEPPVLGSNQPPKPVGATPEVQLSESPVAYSEAASEITVELSVTDLIRTAKEKYKSAHVELNGRVIEIKHIMSDPQLLSMAAGFDDSSTSQQLAQAVELIVAACPPDAQKEMRDAMNECPSVALKLVEKLMSGLGEEGEA